MFTSLNSSGNISLNTGRALHNPPPVHFMGANPNPHLSLLSLLTLHCIIKTLNECTVCHKWAYFVQVDIIVVTCMSQWGGHIHQIRLIRVVADQA